MTVDAMRPVVGPVHAQLERLTPLLGSRGVCTTVVSGALPRGGPRPAPVGHADVVRIPGARRQSAGPLSFTALGTAWIVRDLPHVVHARGLRSAATAAMLGAHLTRRPYVATVLGSGPHGDIARLRTTTGGEWRLRAFARTAAAFVCVDRAAEEDLLELGVDRRRVVRISHGVDIERFRPRRLDDPATGALRASLGLPTGGPLTVTAGRLEADTRVDRVIAAHASAPGTLLIVGGGSQEARLREFARAAGVADRVIFRPSSDDVAPFLSCADAYVTCTVQGGLPTTVLEAMASGLPVVAARSGDTAEVVDATTGVLVESEAPDVFGRATAALLDDQPRRGALGVAGRQRVVAEHTLTRTADELTALYRRIRR